VRGRYDGPHAPPPTHFPPTGEWVSFFIFFAEIFCLQGGASAKPGWRHGGPHGYEPRPAHLHPPRRRNPPRNPGPTPAWARHVARGHIRARLHTHGPRPTHERTRPPAQSACSRIAAPPTPGLPMPTTHASPALAARRRAHTQHEDGHEQAHVPLRCAPANDSPPAPLRRAKARGGTGTTGMPHVTQCPRRGRQRVAATTSRAGRRQHGKRQGQRAPPRPSPLSNGPPPPLPSRPRPCPRNRRVARRASAPRGGQQAPAGAGGKGGQRGVGGGGGG